MKQKHLILPLLGLWFLGILLACNLSGPETATLVPRPTVTPAPTLGYATLSPDELPQQPTNAPSADFQMLNLLNQVEMDRLMIHIDSLQSYGTRHVNSGYTREDWGIGAAYTYIRKQFDTIAQQTGNLIVFDLEFPLKWADVDTRARNVVAVINGTELGAGVVVVGAHYDSISFDPNDSTVYAPGANDDGSGVAALLELARILSQRPHRSSIMLIAFSAEEVGRKGSIAFVDDYVRPRNIPVIAMINLDIIGSQTGPNGEVNDRQLRVFSAGPENSASRQLARAMNFIAFNHMPTMELVVQDREDREGRYGDHLSFSEAGYPAIRLIQALEDRTRNHSERDTTEGIHASYLAKSTQTALALITALADGLRPPRNINLRDNGNGTRRLVWEPVPEAAGYVVALRRPGSLYYNQQFPINDNFVDWEKFIPTEFAGVTIAAKDSSGLIGPPSAEYFITQ